MDITIDSVYDVKKFDAIIEEAAAELMKSTMGKDADTAKGAREKARAAENLRTMFCALPVTYYQALEAFADGNGINALLNISDDFQKEYQSLTFTELVFACKDGRLTVKDEKAALDYYGKRFPDREKNNVAPDVASVTDTKRIRDLAVAEGKEKAASALLAYKSKAQSLSDVRRNNGIQYKSYMSRLKSEAPKEAKLFDRIIRSEEKENRKIDKAEARVKKAEAVLIALQSLKDTGLMTSSEQKSYDKANSAFKTELKKASEYGKRLEELNEKRFKDGKINKYHFERRQNQIQCGDTTYRAMFSSAQTEAVMQLSNGERAGADEATAFFPPVADGTARRDPVLKQENTSERKAVDFTKTGIKITTNNIQKPVGHSEPDSGILQKDDGRALD